MTDTSPLTPDQQAAHDFLTELRTRIATQPLPYQYGIEARALESLWEVFAQGRAAIKKYPGCEAFARTVTALLNEHLRPVTAKWHRPLVEGRLDSRDGADEFRQDLLKVQAVLRVYANTFHQMAYASDDPDQLTPDAFSQAALETEFHDLEFGIPPSPPFHNRESTTQINADEREEIQARRQLYHINTAAGHNAVGLALSGGGIRSATFGLGVVQVLAERKLFQQVDYLSTVSGGGYTGSFLSQCLGHGCPESLVASPHGPDPEPIRYLRQHAKFLAARNLKQSWAMVSATLGGMLLNWMAPLFVVTLAALLGQRLANFDRWLSLCEVFALLTGFALVAWGICLSRERRSARIAGAALGGLSALTALTGLVLAIFKGHEWIVTGQPWLYEHWTLSATLGGLVTAVPAMIRFLPMLKQPKLRQLVLKVLLWTAGLLAPLLALVLFYALFNLGQHGIDAVPGEWILGAIAIFSGLIAFKILNINLTGPHRLYRDGLAKTFVQLPGTKGGVFPLENLNPSRAAPYHLINTALNLPSSETAALQDRHCDFFLFSKHWLGAPSVGYAKTGAWRANGQPVDLATAMATSGAALSAHMGLGAMPTLTAMLALLNLRLGFWIKNPRIKSRYAKPGFWCLIREILGIGMSEDKPWLNLSDGGHIENMAVYELLRRRCKFIICVDGEADPDFSFGGLMTLVRHAQIDFGVRIEPALNEIRPNPQTGLSKAHSHFCRIHYPPLDETQAAGVGYLLYVKLSVTGNESELIKRYRITHPDFPHQTTLDQFFDEEQFEAYRQLGVHAAEGLFSRALMGEGAGPESVRDWFQRLAGKLLMPE